MYQPGVPEESFPESKVTQIPLKREMGSFLGPCSSMMSNDGGKKRGQGARGQMLESGRCRLVILAGVENGMWGSRNVLEFLEQSGDN